MGLFGGKTLFSDDPAQALTGTNSPAWKNWSQGTGQSTSGQMANWGLGSPFLGQPATSQSASTQALAPLPGANTAPEQPSTGWTAAPDPNWSDPLHGSHSLGGQAVGSYDGGSPFDLSLDGTETLKQKWDQDTLDGQKISIHDPNSATGFSLYDPSKSAGYDWLTQIDNNAARERAAWQSRGAGQQFSDPGMLSLNPQGASGLNAYFNPQSSPDLSAMASVPMPAGQPDLGGLTPDQIAALGLGPRSY